MTTLSPALVLAVIFAFMLGWRYLKYMERRDGGAWVRGPQNPPPMVAGTPPAPDPWRALRRAATWCAVGVALLLWSIIAHGGAFFLLAALIVLLVGVVRMIFAVLEGRP
jgi:hypothetical protein